MKEMACQPSDPMAVARTPAHWTNKNCRPSVQAVSQLSLSQVPRSFGARHRGLPAFLARSNSLKNAMPRRLIAIAEKCPCDVY